MKLCPWAAGCLGCSSDLMQKALVETDARSDAKQNGNSHVIFSDAASNGKHGLHTVVKENASDFPVGTSTRAFNLDKADREYKGRQYTKARQAALGEEVRQKIAGIGHKEEQDLTNHNGPPRSQQLNLHNEDRKLDVAANNAEDPYVGNADLDHEKEHGVAKTFASLSTGKYGSQGDMPDRGRNSKSVDWFLSASSIKTGVSLPESSEMSWGHSYTMKELEEATNSFCDDNVLGRGTHAVVYRGVVSNGTHIVLKNLLNNRGQAGKEFKSEVEAIGRIRHKNLVRLNGYCTEGPQRILIYEYIDNGNLEQWLHGPLGKKSVLSWDIRMKTIIGTAKGLAYLHEGLEPKVVHRDIKPSNILLDRQWNPKVSDFGFAKLVGTGKSHVTTRVMGTFGYVAPEYVSTGMLTEKSDVYSYGVLVMELITGRIPFDRTRPAGEVHLIDWLKSMVGSRRSEDVADPSMKLKPSTRSLKRALLVALRCVDPDASRRPKMSHVVHMLESADDNPFCQEPKIAEVYSQRRIKLLTIPAFMLPQKSNAMDRSAQNVPFYNWHVHGDGGFVGSIDRKATWKYER